MGKIKKKAFSFYEIQGKLSGTREGAEAKYTSVNLEAGKEWLKGDLASPR